MTPDTAEFWRRRIGEAQVDRQQDPVRAAVNRQSYPEVLRIAKRSLRILDAHVSPGSRVFDAGCGCGDLYPLLEKPALYTGVDVVAEFVSEATKSYGMDGDRTVRFLLLDIVEHDLTGFMPGCGPTVYDVVLGRDIAGTVGGTIGAKKWAGVLDKLLRIAPRVLLWSYQHTVPEVWGRSEDEKSIKLQEAQ